MVSAMVAVMVATLLALVVLPALYVTVFGRAEARAPGTVTRP
ncbi:MAG: hypothetical protein O9325_18610 [Roseomonas sp.]|nr:hypothetical protein [Roseomonas sp.]